MSKLPELFSAFCVTIYLLPNTPDMNTFLGKLQDMATRKKSAQTSNEMLLYVKTLNPKLLQQTQSKTTKQPSLQGAHLSLLWLQRSHSARLSEKEKGQCQENLLLLKVNLHQNQTWPTHRKKQFSLALRNILHIWLEQLPQPLMSG